MIARGLTWLGACAALADLHFREAVRVLRWPGTIVVLAIPALCFAQEPLAFRRGGLDVSWSSIGRITLLVVCLAPLYLSLHRSPRRVVLERRGSVRPECAAIGRGIGVGLSLFAIASCAAIASITWESIRFSAADWSRFSILLGQAALLATILGPASMLLDFLDGPALRTLVWTAAMIVATAGPALPVVVPFDRLLGTGDFARIWDSSIILPLGLATIGTYLTVIASNRRSRRG